MEIEKAIGVARRGAYVRRSPEEMSRLIASAGNLKHETALSVDGAGLRAREVVALKVGDVDSQRMTPRIE